MKTLLVLFSTFFKIGLFTIGGGYAMIPLIRQEVVSRGWMTDVQLTDFIAISQITPGPFAINLATFIGQSRAGIFGAVVATAGVALPSFIIILIVVRVFDRYRKNRFVQSGLMGLRPAVIGLIAASALALADSALVLNGTLSGAFMRGEIFKGILDVKGIIILGVILAITRFKKIHPVYLIVISAGLGIVFYGLL